MNAIKPKESKNQQHNSLSKQIGQSSGVQRPEYLVNCETSVILPPANNYYDPSGNYDYCK